MIKTIELLAKFGLDKKEAAVYIASLQLGNSSAFDIAQKAGLPKSSVHDILKSLNHKGFVSVYKKKNKKYFSPSSPQVIQDKKVSLSAAADDLVAELKAIANTRANRPSIRFYENKSGIETVFPEILSEAEELLVVSANSMIYKWLPEYFPKMIQDRVKAGVRARSIYMDDKQARINHERDLMELRKSKIIADGDPKVTPTMWLWNNKAVFLNTKGNFSVLVIEDSEIVNLLRRLFESTWKYEPEVE